MRARRPRRAARVDAERQAVTVRVPELTGRGDAAILLKAGGRADARHARLEHAGAQREHAEPIPAGGDGHLDENQAQGGVGAWYDVTLGLTMLIGRFAPVVLALAIAGSLAGARVHARTRATLDTAGLTFAGFLTGVIVIVGGLIYFPMLILGPIGERITG
jgi:hypothetical protein